MSAIIIPDLYCPFPSTIHPHVEALGQHAVAWARRFHLLPTSAAVRRFRAAQYWVLIARAYPTARFADLILATDWNCWGFLLDDIDDESPLSRQPDQMQRLFTTILRVMQGDTESGDGGPLIAGLSDVWDRIAAVTTPAWQIRFRATLAAGLTAYRWEAMNRVAGIIPTREAYIVQRRQTGGWLTDVALVDVLAQVEMTDELLAEPGVQGMLEAANNAICWANDLYSLEKEVTRGEVHNLAVILHHEEGGTLQEAVNHVAALHDGEVRRFEAIVSSLPILGDDRDRAISAYRAFCQAFMRGNIDWARASGRYRRDRRRKPEYLSSAVATRAQQRRGFLANRWCRHRASPADDSR